MCLVIEMNLNIDVQCPIVTHSRLGDSVVTNVCSQAIFASSIPEIIDLVGSRSKYGGEYKREHGKRYTNKTEPDKVSVS